MNTIAVLTPSEVLSRYPVPQNTDRRPSAGAARLSGLRSAALWTGALALTSAVYGTSIAWVLSYVRDGGAAFVLHLVGQAG